MNFMPGENQYLPQRPASIKESAAMDSLALTLPAILSFNGKDIPAASYDPKGGTLLIPQLPDMKRVYDEIDS
jgi:hypothetical protein